MRIVWFSTFLSKLPANILNSIIISFADNKLPNLQRFSLFPSCVLIRNEMDFPHRWLQAPTNIWHHQRQKVVLKKFTWKVFVLHRVAELLREINEVVLCLTTSLISLYEKTLHYYWNQEKYCEESYWCFCNFYNKFFSHSWLFVKMIVYNKINIILNTITNTLNW